jgi:hypothetical protein
MIVGHVVAGRMDAVTASFYDIGGSFGGSKDPHSVWWRNAWIGERALRNVRANFVPIRLQRIAGFGAGPLMDRVSPVYGASPYGAVLADFDAACRNSLCQAKKLKHIGTYFIYTTARAHD